LDATLAVRKLRPSSQPPASTPSLTLTHPLHTVHTPTSLSGGRSCETYSEDPLVIGTLGAQIIDGAMHGNDGASAPYLKMIVAAKHGTAYQTESNRFGFNDIVTAHDIAATYLPAWELAARCDVPGAGCVTGYMCAYPALNSVPLCASAWFSGLMRQWGMGSDPSHAGGSYTQGDCGALDDISDRHHWNNLTKVQAMAYVLNQATADIDCGGALPGNALPAVAAGLTTMAKVEASLARTLTLQFLAGRFDPLQAQPYTTLPFEAVDAPASLALANEGAQQGMVLLRNDGGLLPLTPGARLACIGPHCNTTVDLMGNYFEQRW
jgi:beta-glucosidase